MAAQFLTFMTLLEPGDEIVASTHLYGGTITQLTHTLKKLSVKVHFVEPTNLDNWARAITPKTRFLYGGYETPVGAGNSQFVSASNTIQTPAPCE